MSQPIDAGGQGAPASAPSGAGSTDPTAGQPNAGAPSGTDPQAGQQPAAPTQEAFEQIKRQLQAADRAREAAQQEAKTLKDAQLSEEDRRKQALQEAQAELAKKDEALKQLKLENAFVTDNTYKWHDPKTALKVADLSGVTIDDTGKVTGLKEALKATAEANPWMIKTEDGTSAPSGGAPAGPTGVAGGAVSNASGVNKTELEKKFPALRGRAT